MQMINETPVNDNFQNIIDIYKTLYKMSDALPSGELQDGYDECLYLFMREFRKLENINLHIENYNINRELDNVIKSRDNLIILFDQFQKERKQIAALKAENISIKKRYVNPSHAKLIEVNKRLAKENEDLKSALSRVTIKGMADILLLPVEIDYAGEKMSFYIGSNQEMFDQWWPAAIDYIKEKSSRKKKQPDINTLRNWFVDFFRNNGFMCSFK